MDVYTAKLQLEKLLRYVEGMASVQPRLYTKSKERWKDVADLCIKVVKQISLIVQDELLENGDEGFESVTAEDVRPMIDSIQSEIATLKQFIHYQDPDTASPATVGIKIPREVKQQALATYGNVISKTSERSTHVVEVDKLLSLLNRWMTVRFDIRGRDPDFRYNIMNIQRWLTGWVWCAGYNIDHHTFDGFLNDTNSWLDAVERGENTYAVPADVYRFSTQLDSTLVSLVGVVMWDVLFQNGFYMFDNQPDPYNVFPHAGCLYDTCNILNPDVLDRYVPANADSSILKIAGLEVRND